jgi:hypothetical protein
MPMAGNGFPTGTQNLSNSLPLPEIGVSAAQGRKVDDGHRRKLHKV